VAVRGTRDANGDLSGSSGSADVTLSLVASPAVVDRHVFYNNSAFDGNQPDAGQTDDAAIATDKAALLPGQTADFANYTNYSRGINGLMVDVVALPADGTLDATDFIFRTGNGDLESFTELTTAPLVNVREGAGSEGADRVTLTWPGGAILNQWLEVTMLANADTGLLEDDVFYFGNAVAETGNVNGDTKVTTTDMLLARNNPHSFLDPAAIDLPYDFNRDGRVNTTDVLLARNNQTTFLSALSLLDLSGEASAASVSPAEADWLVEFTVDDGDSSEESDPIADAVDQLLSTVD